jgi:hypothetical protein
MFPSWTITTHSQPSQPSQDVSGKCNGVIPAQALDQLPYLANLLGI